MKTVLPYFKTVASAMILVLLVSFGQKSFGQTTIVDYNFNAGVSFGALAPTLATGITSTAAGSAAFGTAAGVVSGGNAFTANAAAGNALSSARNNTWTFTLGGTNLPNYGTFKIYFQAQRGNGPTNTIAVAYSYNGGAYTTTNITSTPITGTTYNNGFTLSMGANGTWYEAIFSLPTAANSPTSLAFRLTIGVGGGTNNVQLDNFEVQALLNCTAPTSIAASATATTVSATAINGSFTAAPVVPTGYVVVRTTTNTQPAIVNGTTYTVGANGIGYIEYVNTAAGTWSSTGLTGNTTYYYWVFSYNNTACTGPVYSTTAQTAKATTCLATPTLNAVSGLTTTGFTANWNAVGGATTYTLEVSTNAGFTAPVAGSPFNTGNVTSYAATGLTNGNTYYYRLTAIGGICNSGVSAVQNTTLECAAPASIAATTTATTVSATVIDGSFTAAPTPPTGYVVVRTTTNTQPTPANGTTYTVGNHGIGYVEYVNTAAGNWTSTLLTGNTTYYYWVFSYNNTTCSGGPVYSTTAQTANATTCLATPVLTAATGITTTGFTANWGAVTGATSYSLEVSTNAGFTAPIAGSPFNTGNVTSYAVTGLTSGNRYYYRLTAIGGSCNSAVSAVRNTRLDCAAPTAQPTLLVLTPASTTSISGSFTAASPTSSGYLVVRSTSATLTANPTDGTTYFTGNGLGGGTVVQASAATTFTSTGLTANTLYYFFIFSYNNTTCTGGPTYYTIGPLTGNSYTACAAAAAPTALTFPANTPTSIGGSFTAGAGVSGYLIVESTNATLSSDPVFGTTYTAGNSLGGGTVVQVSTATTFTYSPASANTLYYFFIYSYNTGGTCGTSYSTQLTGSSYTSCVAPTAQPTSLILTPTTATSVSGSFTAASPAPSDYLVVRTTTATAPTNPINGTSYTAGSAALGGTIVATNASTSFTDNGLTASTTYWYWVFSFNNTCSGGPLYYTTSPLTSSVTTGSQKNWVGAGAGGIGTDFNTATNWAPAVAPTAGDNLIMNITSTTSGYVVALSANTTINSLTVTYSTALAATSNWTLSVPSTFTLATTSDFSLTNSITSANAFRTGTLNLSVASGGTLTVGGNLTATASTSPRREITAINNSGIITVAGTTVANNLSTNGVSRTEFLTASGAITTFTGAVTFDDGTSTEPVTIGALTNGATGEFDFQNNLILGPNATVNVFFTGGTVLFDAPGSQTITDNIANPSWNPGNITIGSINNPIVTVVLGSGTAGSDDITAQANLTINGSSTLILPVGETINNYSDFTGGGATGTFTINSTATLELGDVTNGQAGSNFPTGFTTVSLNPASTVEYDGLTAQTVYSTPTYGNLTIGDATALPPSNATAGGALAIAGNLLINTGATFAASTYSHQVQGNWTNNGTFSTGTGTVTFSGSTIETIGGSSTTGFNNLTINQTGSGSITLSAPVTVGSALTLTNGIVTSSTASSITVNNGGSTTGASNASFINGPIIKIGADAFTFPVGVTGTGYVPIGISAPSTTTDAFLAQYIRASATALTSTGAPLPNTTLGLDHVSNCDYWILNHTAGSSPVDVTGYWNANNPCNGEIPGGYVNDMTTIVLAHYNASLPGWDAFGTVGNTTGNTSAGSVTWTGVSNFSPFSLASTMADNPLPVVLVNFNAALNNNKTVGLTWTTEQESNLNDFEVERSADGINWVTIGTVQAKGNSVLPTDYGYTDQTPLSGANYYRLTMINMNGNYGYSVVKVVNLLQVKGITVFPIPARDYVNVSVSQAAVDLNVKLVDQVGQVLQVSQVKAGTSAILTLDVHNYAQGTYFLQISGADGTQQTSKVVIMR